MRWRGGLCQTSRRQKRSQKWPSLWLRPLPLIFFAQLRLGVFDPSLKTSPVLAEYTSRHFPDDMPSEHQNTPGHMTIGMVGTPRDREIIPHGCCGFATIGPVVERGAA